jgi:hypothetical protein
MINLDLEKQIKAQIEQTIRNYIVSSELQDLIKKQVDTAIIDIVNSVANRVYVEVFTQNLVSDVDTIVKQETYKNIQNSSALSVRQALANIPLQSIIEDSVKQELNLKLDTLSFPDASIEPKSIRWHAGSLTGSSIRGGRIEKFQSLGIDDQATDYQILITDGMVVVDKELTVATANITENLNVNNISILGTLEIGTEIIDHGPFSQLMQMHSSIMIDQALEPYKSLLKDGVSIINQNSLDSSITQSNLRKVGNLIELSVIGDAKFSETLYVSEHGKVGINTEEPRGALTIWDDGVEATLMRGSGKSMFFGSTRDNDLEIGSHGNGQITFKENQIDINSVVRIQGLKFSVSTDIPEYNGETNEIVFVSNAKADQPKFYICLGGNRWKSMI